MVIRALIIIVFVIFCGFLFGAVYFYVNREFYDYADKLKKKLEEISGDRSRKMLHR